jgi:hypothetical protein
VASGVGQGVVSVDLEGLPEVEAKLTAIGLAVKNTGNKKALDRAGVIMRDAIYAEARSSFVGQSEKDPGGLLRGITYQTELTPGNEHVVAGPIWGRGTHARHLVIDGHNIVHRKGGPILGRSRSNDFVLRGQNASQEAAIAAVEEELAAAIESAT